MLDIRGKNVIFKIPKTKKSAARKVEIISLGSYDKREEQLIGRLGIRKYVDGGTAIPHIMLVNILHSRIVQYTKVSFTVVIFIRFVALCLAELVDRNVDPWALHTQARKSIFWAVERHFGKSNPYTVFDLIKIKAYHLCCGPNFVFRKFPIETKRILRDMVYTIFLKNIDESNIHKNIQKKICVVVIVQHGTNL